MRFGLLGTGYWADTVHAAGLAAHPEVEFAGVWGRDAAKAATVAERHGTTAEADLDALLAKVDAVAIALPPDVQAELAYKAVKQGCHLLLEKPLALSVEDADRVVAAAESAGVHSVIFFTRRFQEPTADWFDAVVAPTEWHGGNVLWVASIFTPDNPFGHSAWRKEHGALWDLGPHALAALLPGLGPVAEVVAERGHDDEVHLVLRHEAGGASSATLSLTAAPPAQHSTVEFWGPAGIAESPPQELGPATDALQRAISALLVAVETGVPHPCDVHFARDIVRVLAAAERFLDRPRESRGERP
ncbi:MAG: Gfo/Idh/MocA family oxidoreductase [Actinobacteria bacterium]|nr:Gfo/Idh/MocA family oxidoreductase [Actinomycetota bacterium]